MPEVYIKRLPESGGRSTPGELTVIRDGKSSFKCVTLELPWKENKRQVSCIPKGKYKVVRRYTEKRGWHFLVTNVPGRDYILFHPGNYYQHTLGCILPGRKHADLNKDGVIDLAHSSDAMADLLKAIPENEFTLIIS